MRPAVADFRAPPGGTLVMGVVLYGRDPRTGAVGLVPRPGEEIEWTVEWPGGDEVLTQAVAPRCLRIDRRTGVIAYPVTTEQAEGVAASPVPAPTRIRLLLPDGTAYPFLAGTVAFGDPPPMQNAPVLFESLTVPGVDVLPRVEPYIVGVVLSYPLGAADQAVADAASKVAELLAQPDLGAALAVTPDDAEDSPRVATAAMVQAVARAVVEQARDLAAAAVHDLLTTPGRLRDMLPTEPPDRPGLPWLDRGGLVITGMNPPDGA